MKQSSRSKVDPFIVMDVMEQARALESSGKNIVHMEVGQPSSPALTKARSKVISGIKSDTLGYTVALGLPELRQKISLLYGKWYNIDLDPSRVVITAGSSAAFILSFISLFEAGDKVGVTEPGYPSYRQILKSLSINPVGLPTSKDNRHIPKLEGQNLNGAIIASPANPTGSILSKGSLTSLINECVDQKISFISDEIYHGLHYDFSCTSALEISDDVYVINSFSKYFSMTGWRIGWMIVPKSHVRLIERLAQNLFICAPHASQIAALGALESIDEAETLKGVYKVNRDLLLNSLSKLGLELEAEPDGGFYLYLNVASKTNNSLALAQDILVTAGVALTPGIDFDPKRGNTTIRISFARDTIEIKEGIDRLARYFSELE
jgi:aspartate/methionine/tyrosine aminotransferase